MFGPAPRMSAMREDMLVRYKEWGYIGLGFVWVGEDRGESDGVGDGISCDGVLEDAVR